MENNENKKNNKEESFIYESTLSNLKIEILDDNIIFKGYRENLYTVIDNIVDNAKRFAKTDVRRSGQDEF